ncbi:uncharacterized protein V1477_004780 [Vespula maculifrons]|uniref:Uncharacterized protein n=1 Tax=Vespula maculifrons TaxID=7453 RepID=A0ABD2CNU8_VESMC
MALMSNLQRKVRSVLEIIKDLINLTFLELKVHFRENLSVQGNYTEFSNRRTEDNLTAFAKDLDKLSRFVYPKCIAEMQAILQVI